MAKKKQTLQASSSDVSESCDIVGIFKRGKKYEVRRQYKGHKIYESGYASAGAAREAMDKKISNIDSNIQPAGKGPQRTCLAQALQDHAMSRLPFMKGAPQEARRINSYLRAAGLPLLQVKRCASPPAQVGDKTGAGAHFEVTLVAHTNERIIPRGLGAHRKDLLTKNVNTERHRAVLATTPMSKVSRHMLQEFVYAMMRDHNAPATIELERSLLRTLFFHAFGVWRWTELADNPATLLKMPTVRNARSRVLSENEEKLLEQALQECRNPKIAPTLTLLRETAMRASEPLEQACWGDVLWEKKVLILKDDKGGGGREVPLSPVAMSALRELGPGQAHERIVNISYEALRAAWNRACARAGIEDLRIHDLRHTAATRMALRTGNIFLVQALTGHKTLSMSARYVNVNASDVVKIMHEAPLDVSADAAVASNPAQPASAQTHSPTEPLDALASAYGGNVIAFMPRRAA